MCEICVNRVFCMCMFYQNILTDTCETKVCILRHVNQASWHLRVELTLCPRSIAITILMDTNLEGPTTVAITLY